MLLPKSWNDIDVLQFKELRTLKDIPELFSREIEALATLTGLPSEDLEDYDVDEIQEFMNKVKWINSEPPKKYKSEVAKMHFKGFNKLTLGEFIDIEYFFSKDYIENISEIAAICYKKTKKNEWKETIYEPYTYSPFDRAYLFDEIPIPHIYGIIPEYLSFRDNFMKTYANLFEPEFEEEETEEDTKDLTPEEKKEIQEEQKIKKWSWERLLYSICNEDLTKISQASDLSLIFVFNMLSMKKELNL